MGLNFLESDDFAQLRQDGGYYVDKTRFLVNFLQDQTDPSRFRAPAKATLFTRPRRFGKTLFMTMLAEFFDITKDSRELFADLAVSSNEALCAEWMNQYPVISFSLKDANKKSHELSLEKIHALVCSFCNLHKYLLSSERVEDDDKRTIEKCMAETIRQSTLESSLVVLTKALSCHYGKPAIVLIDEYDVPVATAAENGYYDEMIDFMRSFLSPALKGNNRLKFAIITGALRITKESMFTGLNNLKCFDISSHRHADIFGFTQAEVDKMLADVGCEDKRDIIREWYDGYHIGKRTDMYCPWSIMSYLDDLQDELRKSLQNGQQDGLKDGLQELSTQPKAYWVNTSGNELTKGFLDHVPANIQDDMASLLAGNSINAQLNETLNYTQLYDDTENFWTLLYLTGYLTTTSDSANGISPSDYESRSLAIPNKEVRKVFEKEIKSWFKNIVHADKQADFFQKFWDADAPGLEKMLNEMMLSSASFRDYQYREFFYHSLLLGIFMPTYKTLSNREAGKGIFDLAIHDKDSESGAVIEVKRARSEEDLDKFAQAALEQIADRKYDERLKADGRKQVLHWGMAFFKKSCRVAVRIATSA